MPKIFVVQSLEETCFSYILQALNEYPADVLALLPIDYRRKMLHKIPAIDICRLEQTAFVSGLDVEKVWEHICKGFTDAYSQPSKGTTWKDFLLETVCRTILRNGRPYGYFQWMSRAYKSCPWVCNKIVEDHPADKQPMDVVNCLVAVKREKEPTPPSATNEDSDSDEEFYRHKYGPSCVNMTRHEVTIHKGVVPPTPMYSESCKLSLSVPKRYTHLFTQDGHFLPDSTAIALLMEKCSYYPKDLSISCREYSTFLEHFEHENTELSLLVEFFKRVESLTFIGELDRQLAGTAYPKAKNMKSTMAIPSKVLSTILLNLNPVLSSLQLSISKRVDDITGSVDQILTTSFSGLKSFTLGARGTVSPDLEKLIAITNHQEQLQDIKISIHEVKQIFGSFGPIRKSTPKFSFALLYSWVQSCLQKPTLKHLNFSVTPITSNFLQQVVVAFLSTPCSCEQTLTLSASNVDDKSADTSVSAPVAPFLIDDACSLQYKCLFLETGCGISVPFATWLFTFERVKLKQVIINSLCNLREGILSQIAEGSMDFESLIFRGVSFYRATVPFYKSLFTKPSLKSLNFEGCSVDDIDFSNLTLGLVEQVRIGQLVNLAITCSHNLIRDKFFEDSAGLKKFFTNVFSLPQLPEFSLTLHVPLTGEHIAMILSTWEQTRKVQLKVLSVLVVESEKTTSMESDLLKIATTVNIETIAIIKKEKKPLFLPQKAPKPLRSFPQTARKQRPLFQTPRNRLPLPPKTTNPQSEIKLTRNK